MSGDNLVKVDALVAVAGDDSKANASMVASRKAAGG